MASNPPTPVSVSEEERPAITCSRFEIEWLRNAVVVLGVGRADSKALAQKLDDWINRKLNSSSSESVPKISAGVSREERHIPTLKESNAPDYGRGPKEPCAGCGSTNWAWRAGEFIPFPNTCSDCPESRPSIQSSPRNATCPCTVIEPCNGNCTCADEGMREAAARRIASLVDPAPSIQSSPPELKDWPLSEKGLRVVGFLEDASRGYVKAVGASTLDRLKTARREAQEYIASLEARATENGLQTSAQSKMVDTRSASLPTELNEALTGEEIGHIQWACRVAGLTESIAGPLISKLRRLSQSRVTKEKQ